MKKTSLEIKNIKKACSVSDLAFDFILKKVNLGISEKQLAKQLSKFLRDNSDGIAFRSIVAFGENSEEIHHRPTDRKLQAGDTIMLDFGAKVNGYCSDISRTVFFEKISIKQKKVYEAVLKAQKKAIEYLELRIRNHKSCKAYKVDKVSRDYLRRRGFDFPHSLGHGLGKKVHQGPRLSPKSRSYLKPGMVFTVEPGIYLKEFGVRIEDDILIKNDGIEILTKADKKLIEVKNSQLNFL